MNDTPLNGKFEESPSENQGNNRSGRSPFFRLLRWIKDNIGLKSNDGSLKAAIEEVLEEHEEDGVPLDNDETLIFKNMLHFVELAVSDIMVPRSDIIAVSSDTSLEDLMTTFIDQQHSRFPIYGDNLDSILGFIHLKDMLEIVAQHKEFELSKLMRKILFVPPSMKVTDLLLQMRNTGVHIAIVVDEYGGTNGLVTLEDLFEELVGEIQDEHDETEEELQLYQVDHQTWEADARLAIEKLEAAFGFLINEEDEEIFDTLGGLLFASLGHVPSVNEVINHSSGLMFEVLEADARRIYRVRITKKAVEPGDKGLAELSA